MSSPATSRRDTRCGRVEHVEGAPGGVLAARRADNTGPTVLCTVPDQSVWYDDDVTVSCTASDASGLQDPADAAFSLSTDVPGGTETASAQTGSREVCDTLGNCTTAGPYSIQVDKKAPSTSCAAPDGQWHPDDVSIT